MSDGSSKLRVFYPDSYADPFIAELGSVRVSLRPLGASPSAADAPGGRVAYYGAYREVDSLNIPSEEKSEEFLLLKTESAPSVFEYEFAELAGLTSVVIREGAVRFVGNRNPGPWSSGSLQIARPSVIDATGRRDDAAAHWEIVSDRQGHLAGLRLILRTEGLTYPVLLDPSFTTTGSMGTARDSHTATLLASGKVLVAGGNAPGVSSTTSAELYDPETGTWTGTGSLGTARSLHTSTLLPDGEVLVAGGVGSNGYLTSSEIYDPTTGAWSTTGSLNAARFWHTATLLPNGKVLAVGGNNFGALTSSEIYDPATQTWTLTGSLANGRYGHTATLLESGTLLVTGGNGNNTVPGPKPGNLASCELYDPASGTWMTTGSLAMGRLGHTATLLQDGRVLVVGGHSNGGVFAAASEIYDPDSGTWNTTGSLEVARESHTATLLSSGKVLAAGGDFFVPDGDGATDFASAELYDPVSGTWSTTGSLNTARSMHTATLLASGDVLVAGGVNDAGDLTSAELYDRSAPAVRHPAILPAPAPEPVVIDPR